MAKKSKKNLETLTIELQSSKKFLEKQTSSKFILKAKAIDLLELDSPNKVLLKTIQQLHKRTIKINKTSKTILKLEYKIAEFSKNESKKITSLETENVDQKPIKKPRSRKIIKQ